MSFRELGLATTLSLVISACSATAEQPTGELAKAAASAKRAGKTAATVTAILDENGSASPLDDLLKEYSLVVVEPIGLAAATTSTPDWVFTWHVFRIVEQLVRRTPVDPDDCGAHQLPTAIPLESGRITVPIVAGSVTIDGVLVSMDTPQAKVRFKPATRYLLLGIACPSGSFLLPQGELDVFEVDSSGRIVAPYGANEFPFGAELVRFGTLAALSKRLEEIR